MPSKPKSSRPAAAKSPGAYAEAEELIAGLGPTNELAREVRRYPVELLRKLVSEFKTRRSPVPDHALDLVPYLGETALRALLAGGLAERVGDNRYALHAYQPTVRGIDLAERIDRERDGHATA
ncbi:MAG: hypothetical protein FJ318_07375 [SAR202 cluster bacterium]|nr:hypothetical protein [SAR202 cluster bacterium]